MRDKILAAVWFLVRIFLGSVFVVSGFTKLIKPASGFFSVIESYQILKGWMAMAAAHGMPWLELIFGVYFILGLWTRRSLAVLWSLNMVFIAVLTSAILRKLPIESCGCLGESLTLKPAHMLIFDLFLWVFFALSLVSIKKLSTFSLDRFFDK